MTDLRPRDLDAWIAEKVFGYELEDGDDCKILKEAATLGDLPKYTSDPFYFAQVKRSMTERGWFWQSTCFLSKLFQFTIDTQKCVTTVDAESEELAGCMAFKLALEKEGLA